MKILIMEAASPRDGLLASGLRQLLDQSGIPHETVDGSYSPPIAASDPVPEAAASSQKRGRTAGKSPKVVVVVRKPVKTPKPARGAVPVKKVAPASGDEPRLTIRQRVLNILKSEGEMTAAQVHALLMKAGLPASVDTGQHLYLLKRDGLVRFGENAGYILAA